MVLRVHSHQIHMFIHIEFGPLKKYMKMILNSTQPEKLTPNLYEIPLVPYCFPHKEPRRQVNTFISRQGEDIYVFGSHTYDDEDQDKMSYE
ncbi:hypothetical protein STEG23_037971 [Scotinomys teguina]